MVDINKEHKEPNTKVIGNAVQALCAVIDEELANDNSCVSLKTVCQSVGDNEYTIFIQENPTHMGMELVKNGAIHKLSKLVGDLCIIGAVNPDALDIPIKATTKFLDSLNIKHSQKPTTDLGHHEYEN